VHLANLALRDREPHSRERTGAECAAHNQQHGEREKHEDAQGQQHLPAFIVCIEFSSGSEPDREADDCRMAAGEFRVYCPVNIVPDRRIRLRRRKSCIVKAIFDDVYWALRVGLGSTAFLAGLDKFTNLLANWEKYIAPQVRERLPVSGRKFMYGVGAIEMLVGLGILISKPRLAGYTASAWLLGIAVDLILNGDYDIAVRDINLAVAAYALARSQGSRQREQTEYLEDLPLSEAV